MSSEDSIVEARGVEKFFLQPDGRRIEVISPINLSISTDKITALLGPSGCGKSTLLRMFTGLAQPSAGKILWHGRPLDEQSPNVAIVFQSFALFPWLTVLGNVEAPLVARGMDAIERHKRALKILDTVGLDGFERAYPKELSGGMKQRVGFARALVVEPEVLFMDEPFSALDVLTAENLRGELMELWLNKKIPTRAIFLVTHNIEEAVLIADHIVVLDRNPAVIRAEYDVTLPHPRDKNSAPFHEMLDDVYKTLTKKEIKHAPHTEQAQAGAASSAPAAAAKPVPLPHARPGGIAGLLEILLDRGGKDDVYRLAKQLIMEVDDILPIMDAAALLEFVHLHEGDVETTPEGKAFAEADILTRKTMFHDAVAKYVPLLRQMEQSLRAKSDGKLPDDFFYDILEEHFSADEARRQLETAIVWGRYAEIFDYDAGSGRLFLTET